MKSKDTTTGMFTTELAFNHSDRSHRILVSYNDKGASSPSKFDAVDFSEFALAFLLSLKDILDIIDRRSNTPISSGRQVFALRDIYVRSNPNFTETRQIENKGQMVPIQDQISSIASLSGIRVFGLGVTDSFKSIKLEFKSACVFENDSRVSPPLNYVYQFEELIELVEALESVIGEHLKLKDVSLLEDLVLTLIQRLNR